MEELEFDSNPKTPEELAAIEQAKAERREKIEEIRKINADMAAGKMRTPEEIAAAQEREKLERLEQVKRIREENAAAAREKELAEAAQKEEIKPDDKAQKAAMDKASSWENNADFYVELPSKMKKRKKGEPEKSPFIEGTDDSSWTLQLKEGEEYAIKARDVKIRYKSVQSYSIKRSLLKLKKVDTFSFEAVRGVSFEVKKGEIFGITGKNGSGKSTLLRALGHIFSADEGSIDLFGHSISLLAIGVGFMPDLTGRENIMLSGMLLGFSEKEVRAHMDDIVDFAGLGEFIDLPVRTYSSGMHSKLAFSITAFLDTEIMLIDEVFSVGDAKFKKKSYAKMQELISEKDRTVVIVSHNLFTLETLCDRVMWMHDGKIVKIGDPLDIIEEYREFMS